MKLEKFTKLKADAEQCQQEIDRAKGSLDQLLKRLKSEFGVSSIEAAKKLLAELEIKQAAAENKLDKALKKFEQRYQKLIEKEE